MGSTSEKAALSNSNETTRIGSSEMLDLDEVRDELVNKGLIVFSIIFPLTLILSFIRSSQTGWQPFFSFQLTLVSGLILCTLLRKRLSYGIRTGVLLGLFLLMGTANLLTFGLVSGGIVLLFFFTLLTTLAHGTKSGLWSSILCFIIVILIGVAVNLELITFSFDMNQYVSSLPAWAMVTAAFFGLCPTIIIVLGVLFRHLTDSLYSLKESNQRFSLFMKHLPGIAYIKDANGKYIYINDQFPELVGMSGDEILGFKDDIVFPEAAQSLKENDDRVRSQNIPITFEESAIVNGEELFYLNLKFPYPIPVDSTLGVAGVALDISEIKEARSKTASLEKQLRQSQKMETLGTLAGGIAHDFNNILAAQIGFTNLAMNSVPLDSEEYEYLCEVEKASNRAKILVTQILSFARKSDPAREPIAIQDIINEAFKLLSSTIPANINLKMEINPECPNVLADATQIHQIIMNLAANAYHSMTEHGGTITIRLEKKEIDEDEATTFSNLDKGSYVLLSVTDTGHGMDEATLSCIFEPYFSTKKIGEGTGLGLSTVFGIVREHGGDIRVDSKLGRGTTFDLYFPILEGVTEAPAENRDTEQSPTPCGDGQRILFVDDEPQLVALYKSFLEASGYKITSTTSSIEAETIFRKNPNDFDMLITDQSMPGLTGIELAETALSIRSNLPILMCTGFSETVSQEDALTKGIREYIRKPVTPIELATQINQVFLENITNTTRED